MKLSVSKRIWRGFLLILVIMVLIGTMSIVSMNKLKSELSFLIDDRVYKVELTNDLINSQKERYIAISSYVIFKTAEFVEQRDTSTAQSEQIMKKINQAFSEAEHSKLLAEINELHTQFNEMVDTISYQLMRVNETQNRVALKETALLNAELMEKATELKQYQQDAMEQSIQEHEQIVHLLLLFVIVAMGIGIVLALLLSNRISKRIGDPVHQLTGALQEIAKGNFLVEPIHVKEEDEIGLMANSFNRMVEDVRKLLDKIRTASEQLAAQSEELSASSQESLASSETISTAAEQNIVMSEKQSQIVSQTNDAIARLSTDVDQIATSNSTMLQSMQTVVNHIQNGSTSIAKLTEQMNETNTTIGQAAKIIQSMADQSYQIQHVTALITDISEQTNLLALNAAIEAARAGEHGKGFAVVAEEVRKLAEQSKKSATEIGDMIVAIQTATEQAVQAIEAGSTSVNLGHDATHETSTSFQEIKHSVQTVHTNVQQVAHSIHEIHEMSSTIQQASKEIQELAESATSTAQQSSAATEEQLAVNEEISSSSQTLASLAENLQQEIKRFSF